MAFNIEKFRQYFGKNDEIAKTNQFDVWIYPPQALVQDSRFRSIFANDPRTITEGLTFQTETAELPGRSLNTITPKIYGIYYRTPATTDYTDTSITFISTGTFWERVFFDAWIDFIQPKNTFNFEYRNAYSTTIKINQYNSYNQDQTIYQTTLQEAFPISISAQNLNWNGEEAQKLQVVFSYLKWKTQYLPEQEMPVGNMSTAVPQNATTQTIPNINSSSNQTV